MGEIQADLGLSTLFLWSYKPQKHMELPGVSVDYIPPITQSQTNHTHAQTEQLQPVSQFVWLNIDSLSVNQAIKEAPN